MREFLEIRIGSTWKHLFYTFHKGRSLGSVWLVEMETSSFWFKWTRFLYGILHKLGDVLFYSWQYKRFYSKEEIRNNRFCQITPSRFFEPDGEECGTIYDDSTSCPICGSGAKQLSPLILKRYSIPRADLAMTIADGDEVIVSERFVTMVKEQGLSGMTFLPVCSAFKEGHKLKYYQIYPVSYVDISSKTVFGINPFDLSGATPARTETRWEKEGRKFKEYKVHHPEKIYKCPNGDNLGLNILSEAYIKSSPMLEGLDFFASRQTVGMREGVIRPRHLFFCSNRMMNLIKEHKLKGFQFEVAHIVDE